MEPLPLTINTLIFGRVLIYLGEIIYGGTCNHGIELGSPNGEPQEYSMNQKGICLPGSSYIPSRRIEALLLGTNTFMSWEVLIRSPICTFEGNVLTREPPKQSRNMMGMYLSASFPIIFLPYSWGSLFGVPIRVPLCSGILYMLRALGYVAYNILKPLVINTILIPTSNLGLDHQHLARCWMVPRYLQGP